ncbi:MAG: hypothetical protein IT447_05520 [Phycisphaerales bacterium]|jgi:hypothetical protein|nr:hypothetical protein [Phycisphaerales bacterium]
MVKFSFVLAFVMASASTWATATIYTSVADHGAMGNGTTDDTAAIRSAIAAAQARSATVTAGNDSVRSQGVVYFPSGVYKISDTLAIPHLSVMGENGAVLQQTDNTKDILSAVPIWRGVISGISFVGGKNQIYLNNGNTDKTLVVIDKCQFNGAADAAIRTGEQMISTMLTIRDCAFSNCMQTLISHSDKGKLVDCWITSAPAMTHKAVIENYGDLLCENILGVPGVTAGNEQRWIDNYRRVTCRNFRFGGEGAGFTAVVNFAPYQYNPANLVPTSVVLDDCDIYSTGILARDGAAIYCEDIPNQIVVTNCRGLPAGTDPNLCHVVQIKSTINLNTYFDNAENMSRPRALRFLIDPSITEMYWRQQIDLPEQMRPYQANAIEADACPTSGWWKAGAYVRNRNCAGASSPLGWLCVESGKPGVWKAVKGTFTNR